MCTVYEDADLSTAYFSSPQITASWLPQRSQVPRVELIFTGPPEVAHLPNRTQLEEEEQDPTRLQPEASGQTAEGAGVGVADGTDMLNSIPHGGVEFNTPRRC